MKKVALASACSLLLLGLVGCGQSSDSADKASLASENASLKSESAALKNSTTHVTNNDDDDDFDDDDDDDLIATAKTYRRNQEAILATRSVAKAVGITITAADQDWSPYAKRLGERLFQGQEANVVQVQVRYANYALPDDFQPDEDDLRVTTEDGQVASSLDFQDGEAEVTAGHDSTTTLWYRLPVALADAGQLTIEFVDDGQALATWKLD